MNPVFDGVVEVFERETGAKPEPRVAAALEVLLFRAPAIFSTVLLREEVYARGYLDWERARQVAAQIGVKDHEPALLALASVICSDDRGPSPVDMYLPLDAYAETLDDEGFERLVGMLRARRSGVAPAQYRDGLPTPW